MSPGTREANADAGQCVGGRAVIMSLPVDTVCIVQCACVQACVCLNACVREAHRRRALRKPTGVRRSLQARIYFMHVQDTV